VQLFIRKNEKQFLHPATDTFPVKSIPLDGQKEFFCLCFSAHQNARQNTGFFLSPFRANRTGRKNFNVLLAWMAIISQN